LTGAFEPFDQERAKKAGCDGFLAKPFEPQTLISKVKELLKSTGTAAPAAASPAAPSLSSTVRTEATKPTPAARPAPAPAQPAQPAHEEAEDATIMMSPGMAPPMPLPTPVDPEPASDEGAGFQESMAEEAGARALSVDADDRTMFLGPSDDTSSGSSDDIWGEVQSDSSSSEPEPYEEGQTVMMSAPIVPEPIPAETPDAGSDDDSKSADDFSRGFTELPS